MCSEKHTLSIYFLPWNIIWTDLQTKDLGLQTQKARMLSLPNALFCISLLEREGWGEGGGIERGDWIG